MRYLITGGLGVIGSLCAKRLLEQGHTVTIIDDGEDPRHSFNAPDTDLIFQNRLEEMAPDTLTELIDQNDRVLHAAASTGIPYSGSNPRDDWSRNVDGTIALLNALRRVSRPTVVLSSVKPYGLGRLSSIERATSYLLSGSGVDESYPLLPEEPYGGSKGAQSLISHAYAESYGLPLVVFRCSNLFGPAACHGPRHGWLTWFCIRAALGLPIEIQGKGNQTRDMLFWSDVLDACDRAWGMVETLRTLGVRGPIWNLGGGLHNTTSPLQAVATLRSLGATIETTSASGRPHEDNLFVTETGAVGQALGWQPRVNVEEGIARVYEWACENRKKLGWVYAESK